MNRKVSDVTGMDFADVIAMLAYHRPPLFHFLARFQFLEENLDFAESLIVLNRHEARLPAGLMHRID